MNETASPKAVRPEDRAPVAAEARVSGWYIALLMTANFGVSMALIVPMSFSLALRVDQLAPGREEVLGYILGVGSVLSLVTGPLLGTLSDRTRSRFGRRTPYLVVGGLVGMAGLLVMAYAPNIPVLGLGWALTTLGWGTAMASLGSVQADRIPQGQRGKVSGLAGFTTQIAPVAGVLMVGAVSGSALLVFLLPGLAGAALLAPFPVLAREADSRRRTFSDRLTAGRLLGTYVFDPRRHRDFAWNWLGGFAFFFGLSMNTTFVTFLYAQRLEIELRDVAGIVAITGGISVVTSTVGSLGGGFLSDRLGRRRPFVAAGAALFATGSTVLAFAEQLWSLLAGSTLMSLGISVFVAVNQATVLDILPERDTEAGRFMAIKAFSQKVPSALAPMAAPLLIGIGSTAGTKNYAPLYLVSALSGLLGGLIIFFRVRGAP
ncbi:MFS transporter [Spirillospora sp. CA-255316]